VPFVVGETNPALIAEMRTVALACGAGTSPPADVRVVPTDRAYTGPLALVGEHQRRNGAVAEAVLAALPAQWQPDAEAIRRGFASVRVPGRLDRRGQWIFDVAHNPDSMQALTMALPTLGLPRPLHALVSILGDKDWPAMLALLEPCIDCGVLTVAPTAALRRWDLEQLDEWLGARPGRAGMWTVAPDFATALRMVQDGAGSMLVTGSFHTVGDAMEVLGFASV
jgi:dihydrofolate synthase/folylpolyglutamate synthase